MNKTTEVYTLKNDRFTLIGEQHDNSASWGGHSVAVHNIIIKYKGHKVYDKFAPLHIQGMFINKDIILIELP